MRKFMRKFIEIYDVEIQKKVIISVDSIIWIKPHSPTALWIVTSTVIHVTSTSPVGGFKTPEYHHWKAGFETETDCTAFYNDFLTLT